MRIPGFSAFFEVFVQPRQVLIADVDDDGDDDVITYPSALGPILTLHRNTNASFSLEALSGDLEGSLFGVPSVENGVSVTAPTHLLSGKFLHGGELSLVTYGDGVEAIGNPGSLLTSWSGTLADPTALASMETPVLANFVVADLDGDGLDDLVASGERSTDNFGNELLDPSLVYFRSRGDGTFAEPVSLANPGILVSQILVEDIDQDGILDITVILETNNSIVLFRGRRVPGYPSFGEWAMDHSPDNPGLLDRPNGGETNLVLFARGEIPSTSSGLKPQEPPELPTVSFDEVVLHASHPIPRLANGDSVSVTLQYSFDLNLWIDANEDVVVYSRDPAAPEWLIKTWDGVFDFRFSSREVFHRFKVIYVTH